MKNSEVLKVQYKERQGLIFKWNYSNLSAQPKYFYHLLLIYSSDIKSSQQFISKYVKSIKPGDFYSCLFVTQQMVIKKRSWKERMVQFDFDITSYLNYKSIVAQQRQILLNSAQKLCEDLFEPVTFNIFIDHPADTAFFQKYIKSRRLEQKVQFICSFFGPFKQPSRISVSKGINHYSTFEYKLSKILAFHQMFLNQAAVSVAHLTVTCNNGCITSCNDDEWRNQSFNKIQKYYYHPSCQYNCDVISFSDLNTRQDCKYELTIQLNFTCFDKTIFKSEKSVTIKLNMMFNQLLTICPNKFKSYFITQNGIELKNDPFGSQTTIRFNKLEGDQIN